MKFIRKKEPSKNTPHNFKWPDKDDVDVVSRDYIVATLAKPQTDPWGLLAFADENIKNFDIYLLILMHRIILMHFNVLNNKETTSKIKLSIKIINFS